jgi:hypothetical protein
LASSSLLILVSKVLSRYLDHAQREQTALGISDADDMVSSGPHLSEDLLLNRETPVREYTRGRNFLLKIFGNRTRFLSVAIQDSGLTSSEVCIAHRCCRPRLSVQLAGAVFPGADATQAVAEDAALRAFGIAAASGDGATILPVRDGMEAVGMEVSPAKNP